MKRCRQDAEYIGDVFNSLCASLNVKPDKNDVYRLLDVLTTADENDNNDQDRFVVYVLELENNKFYVGKSTSHEGVDLRIAEHKK